MIQGVLQAGVEGRKEFMGQTRGQGVGLTVTPKKESMGLHMTPIKEGLEGETKSGRQRQVPKSQITI